MADLEKTLNGLNRMLKVLTFVAKAYIFLTGKFSKIIGVIILCAFLSLPIFFIWTEKLVYLKWFGSIIIGCLILAYFMTEMLKLFTPKNEAEENVGSCGIMFSGTKEDMEMIVNDIQKIRDKCNNVPPENMVGLEKVKIVITGKMDLLKKFEQPK